MFSQEHPTEPMGKATEVVRSTEAMMVVEDPMDEVEDLVAVVTGAVHLLARVEVVVGSPFREEHHRAMAS
jgi:hypothetical protein